MEYVKIPYVDKEVSRIFYGTAGQPFMMGGMPMICWMPSTPPG